MEKMLDSAEQVAEKVRRYLIEELGLPEALRQDDRLIERGFIASAQLIDLVGFIEDSFGVVLRSIDVLPENLATTATIARVVMGRLAQSGPGA